ESDEHDACCHRSPSIKAGAAIPGSLVGVQTARFCPADKPLGAWDPYLVTRIGSQFPDPGSHHWNGSHIDGTRRVRFSSTALPPARVMGVAPDPISKRKKNPGEKPQRFSLFVCGLKCV